MQISGKKESYQVKAKLQKIEKEEVDIIKTLVFPFYPKIKEFEYKKGRIDGQLEADFPHLLPSYLLLKEVFLEKVEGRYKDYQGFVR